jgi:hypothetical protein
MGFGVLFGIVAVSFVQTAGADAPGPAPARRHARRAAASAPAAAPAAPAPCPATGAAAPGTDAAPATGLMMGPATIAPHWSKYEYPQTIAEGAGYYVIAKGDTLWDLSRRFLNSPYLWPQIWDQNRYIKDAHWIYPGDPLTIPCVQLVSQVAGAVAPGAEPGLDGGTGGAVSQDVLYPAIEEQALLCADFVTETPDDQTLFIIGNEQGNSQIAFSDRDILYLSKGSAAGVKPGDLYTIRHEVYDVRHPDTRRPIGRKVETAGIVRVLLVQDASSTAIVEQSCRDIHTGDYMVPYERPSVPLIVKRAPADRLTPPTGKMNGAVIDMADDRMIAGEGTILTLNLGTRNGITPGNILTVYRVMYPSVPSSRVIVGEVAVVAVREKTATARVTYSADAILAGDRVELR